MLFLLKLETEARSGLRTSPSGSCLSRSEPTVDIWSQIKLESTGRIFQLLMNSLKPLTLRGKTDSSSVKSCLQFSHTAYTSSQQLDPELIYTGESWSQSACSLCLPNSHQPLLSRSGALESHSSRTASQWSSRPHLNHLFLVSSNVPGKICYLQDSPFHSSHYISVKSPSPWGEKSFRSGQNKVSVCFGWISNYSENYIVDCLQLLFGISCVL